MNDVRHTVLYEQSMDPGFLDEVYSIHGGEKSRIVSNAGLAADPAPYPGPWKRHRVRSLP